MDFETFKELHTKLASMLGVTVPASFWNSDIARTLSEGHKLAGSDSSIIWFSEMISRAIRDLEQLSFSSASVQRSSSSLVRDIRKIISDFSFFALRNLENPERKLRREISGVGNSEQYTLHLGVQGYSISEKCLGGCRKTCPLKASGADLQMPWELFDAATSSPDIRSELSVPVHLGDGEVLIYNQSGRKLFDVVDRLVRVCGHPVKFTTAGLIPPNRELGLEFFRSLETLGVYSTDVTITLSFNLYFGFIKNEKDIENYVRCVAETVEAISRTGAKLYVILMSDVTNRERTNAAYSAIEPLLLAYYNFGANYVEQNRRIPNAIGFAEGMKGAKKISDRHCNRIERDIGVTGFILRADGSLSPLCNKFGTRGSRIGNVTVNDIAQISDLYVEHEKIFAAEICTAPATCRAHQKWANGVFTAPRSDKPLIRLRH